MAELNPDEVLKKALKLAHSMTAMGVPPPSPSDGTQLAELLLTLDRWLSTGGRQPAGWSETSLPGETIGTVRSSDAGSL